MLIFTTKIVTLALNLAHAQTSPLAALLGAGAPPVTVLSVEGRLTERRQETPVFTENKISLTSPVYRDERHAVTPTISAGNLSLSERPTLTTGRRVPRDLARLEFGAQYTRQLSERRHWGLRANAGYAGDRRSDDNGNLTFGLAGTYGYPGRHGGYWVLMVLLSNNGPLPNYVPLPGFIYVHRTPTFTGVFGLPILSLAWTPTARWTSSLTAFGPLVRAEVAFGEKSAAQVFAGYAFNQQFFIPDQRPRPRDRLTIQEQRITVGARAPLGKGLSAEVQGGLAYDRSIFIGRGLRDRSGGSAALRPGCFVTAQLTASF